ncbi:MAG: protein kinase [Myxococcota bacterium]
MRRQLLRTIVLLTVLTSGAVLAVSVVFAERGVEALSRNLVEQTTERTEIALQRFFGPLEQQLRSMRMWGEAGMLPLDDAQSLLALVHPFLETHPEVAGLIVARDDGAETFILNEAGEYRVRLLGPKGGPKKRPARWTRFEGRSATDRWTEDTGYSPLNRPWFQGAMNLEDSSATFWTEPYVFFTAKLPGITSAMRFRHGGHNWVVGIDVTLVDISRFTTGLRVSQRGAVAVMTATGKAIGLPKNPKFEDPLAVRQSMLQPIEAIGIEFVAAAVDAGRNLIGTKRGSYRFSSEGESWWGGVRTFQLSMTRPLLIQAVVPESDLLGEVRAERNAILLVIAMSLLVAIVIAYFLGQRYEARLQAAMTRAEKLGQYTLETKIGEGGMGAVYRARHAFLRRPTAIKLLRPDKDDPRAFERFEREVQMTAQLTHPNTIAVYDYGRTSGGTFYYAMEFLEGMSLRELVRDFGNVPASRTVYLLRQVAGSLDEAHVAGLVHRDVTPANIFITRRGGQADFVKVLDFGLVERTDDATAATGGDGETTVLGTPAYMAPELIRTAPQVSTLSDVYAFGCVAYYLLTARNVFVGGDAYEIFGQHLHSNPLPPSQAAGVEIAPELEALVLRCLEKSPAQRPESLGAVKQALDQGPLSRPWTENDAVAWWRKHYLDGPPPVEVKRPDQAAETMAIDLSGRDSPTMALHGKGTTQIFTTQ